MNCWMRLKPKYKLTSEYQLAQKLDVNHSRLYRWRKEQNSMDWEVAFKIADMLNLEDQCVVSGLIDDKYKNPRLINALHQISAA